MLPPDASELDVSVGTTPARDDAARTAQVGAADEGMAEDSLQGTELLSMMEEAGEENEELGDSTGTTPAHDDAAEADLERQRLAQPTKQQGKQQRQRAAAAKAKAQFQGSDVHGMLGGDDEGDGGAGGHAATAGGSPRANDQADEEAAAAREEASSRQRQSRARPEGSSGQAGCSNERSSRWQPGQSQAEPEGS